MRVSARAAERQLGISSAQNYILHELAERPSQSINELAANSYTHQSSVSTVVRRLIEKGLVQGEQAPNDARRVSISLTPSGRALIRKAPASWDSHFAAALRDLSRAQLRTIAACLTTLADAVSTHATGERTEGRAMK